MLTIIHVHAKLNLDSCDDGNSSDGDSPLIVDVEEAVP